MPQCAGPPPGSVGINLLQSAGNVLTQLSRNSQDLNLMVVNGSHPRVAEATGRVWSFAGREFNEARLELRVNGRPVELELKPLEVLVQLLQRAGEVVTKDELLDAVWPGLNVVDGSLSTAVYKLRKALADDDGAIVVTVPRTGYRLAAQVHIRTSRPAPMPAELSFKAGDPVPGREHWRLLRPLDSSSNSEVWLAEHPKTRDLRVFKFISNAARLKALKREVTVFRFLRESIGERPEFVRIFEWNFDTLPCFLESEYGGSNLAEWAQREGGLVNIPLRRRLRVITEIARGVGVAHDAGVLHRDLKPANVLVAATKSGDERIKIADFGSASLLEPERLEALGITNLGMTQTGVPQSSSLSGTLMYMAPEVLSGNRPTAKADVYALGVILYQLVIGDLRKPLSPGWEDSVGDPLIREDIAVAVCGEPARRLGGPAELAERLEHLDQRRVERSRLEQERTRQQIAERKRAEARARRPWIVVAFVALLALVATVYLLRKSSTPVSSLRTVAVLPFQNAGTDPNLDFLSLSLADEVATSLSYARGLSIRSFPVTDGQFRGVLDLQKVAAETNASTLVTGHFLKHGGELQLTLEAIDAKTGRTVWRDTFDVAAENMIVLREKLVARTQGALAAALGGSAFTADPGTRPSNEQAYNLYLRAGAIPMDSRMNKQAVAMLESSVGLDSNYAPAWLQLSRRYYVEARYVDGANVIMERAKSACGRAVALDPGYVAAAAYLTGLYVEDGDLPSAVLQAEKLIEHHPDSADAHYILSYALRYAGLLEESARECDKAFTLDAHMQTSGLRSCSIVFIVRADYARAAEFLNLDPASDFYKAMRLSMLLRAGREEEALQIGAPHIPQWISFDLLAECAQDKASPEISALAARVPTSNDPEANYLAAANLAYCGQNKLALSFLKKAVEGNYCSYPAMDSDPFFTSVRSLSEFAAIRNAGKVCQQQFLAARQRLEQQAQNKLQ